MFSFCCKGLPDLVQAGLTVATLTLGYVQVPVAKQVCCGDPRLVFQNTPHSDTLFSVGQGHCCSPSVLKLHPCANVTSRSAGCIKSYSYRFKRCHLGDVTSVFYIKSMRACGELYIIICRRLGIQRLRFANSGLFSKNRTHNYIQWCMELNYK